jgi:CheY-like chemotaxis protein
MAASASARIREAQQTRRRAIPIVAMSAHAMSGDRELCLGAGMDDYIAKPVAPKDLLGSIGSGIVPRRGKRP